MRILKPILIIVGIIALLAFMGYMYIQSIIDSLVFDYKFRNFNLKLFGSFQSFTGALQAVSLGQTVPIDFDIDIMTTNYSNFKLTARLISLRIFFNGVLFAETMERGAQDFVISPYTTETFSRGVKAYINANNIGIVDLYLGNRIIPLTYEATLIVYGVIFTHRGNYYYDPISP